MKTFLVLFGLLSSIHASAESPIFTLFYKTGYIAEEYAFEKKCAIYENHVDVNLLNAQGESNTRKAIEPDAFWSDLITEASQGELLPDPFSSSFYVSEYLAFRQGKKIILKGFDSQNEPVLNQAVAANSLMDIINRLFE